MVGKLTGKYITAEVIITAVFAGRPARNAFTVLDVVAALTHWNIEERTSCP